MILTDIKDNIFIRINRSDLSKRLFKGVTWSLVGSIGGKIFQLIAFMLVARILGKENYGKVGIIRSTISMFLMFSTLGMSVTASRYISLYRNTDPYKALKVYKFTHNSVVVFGFIIAFLVYLFSGLIADKSLHNANLTDLLHICSVVILLSSITSAQYGALNGFEDFRSLGINSVVNGFLQTVLLIIGAYFYEIIGVIIALGISAAILYIQYWYSLKKNITILKYAPKTDETQFSNISIFIKFSLPAVLSGLVTVPVLWWAKTYLIRNTGFGEMAIYDVAEQWYFMLLFIPNSLSSIILPMLTNVTTEGTEDQYFKLIKLNLKINIAITTVIAIFIAIFTPYIYSFYGKGFTENTPLLILLVTAIICAINNVMGQVIASKGRMWIGFGVNGIWAIWIILFTLLFVGRFSLGATGLAYAMLVSYVLHSITQAVVAFKTKLHKNESTDNNHIKSI